MSESGRVDVAIIGGGPAGSTAAALLAAAGRSVVLFEKERFPRFHIGESLLPFSLGLFHRLGVSDAMQREFVEKWGARVISSDGAVTRDIRFGEAYLPGHPMAYQVVRARFDEILLRNAERLGAEVRQEHEVIAATSSHRDGCEVTVRNAAGALITRRARFLLDASGRNAFIASGRRERKMTPHLRKASVYAHYEGVPRGDARNAGDIQIIVLRDGWFWIIPLPQGRASVGLVAEGATVRTCGLSPENLLENAVRACPAVAELMLEARRVSQVWSASDYSYECGGIAGDGHLLLGDAAAFIDPVFSTGVWLAMSSAELAADLLHARLDLAVTDPAVLSPAAFAGYERKVRRHVRTYTKFVSGFYSPGFMDIFLQPSARYRIKESVVSLLAGAIDPPLGMRLRLRLFYSVVALQRRFGVLAPRVPLLSVLEEARS